MLLRPSKRAWRALSTVVFATSILCFGFLYLAPHGLDLQHVPSFPLWPDRQPSVTAKASPLPLPADYHLDDVASPFCYDRFSSKYLTDLRKTAFQYCSTTSYSSLTCFHSHISDNEEGDSLCIGQGVVLDLDAGRFVLNCDVQEPDANTTAQGVTPLQDVREYWYETGPRFIFEHFVDLVPLSQVEPTAPKIGVAPSLTPSFFTLLIKREGEGNPWHCLMEIWSMAMTIDVLRIARNPADAIGNPFFRVPEDLANLQVVILDDRIDGPYFNLWKLFSGREPIRLGQIRGNPEALEFFNNTPQHIIVPLAGASNPLWQNDWTARDCGRSDTLDTFVRRVLGHYGVSQTVAPATVARGAVRVTFIDRKGSNTRKLEHQDALLAAVRKKYPDVEADTVDFGILTFAQQLEVARKTDVLVGVHGAGLSHIMFLRQHTTAVVEIQPSDMDKIFMGFRNLANMRGVTYFRATAEPAGSVRVALATGHGESQTAAPASTAAGKPAETVASAPSLDEPKRIVRRASWHTENFVMSTDVFVNAVGAAIQSVYNKDLRQHEVVL